MNFDICVILPSLRSTSLPPHETSTRPYFSDLALVKFFSGRTLVNLFSIVIFSVLHPDMSQREGFP